METVSCKMCVRQERTVYYIILGNSHLFHIRLTFKLTRIMLNLPGSRAAGESQVCDKEDSTVSKNSNISNNNKLRHEA